MCGDPLCASCGDPAAERGFEFDALTIEQCESNHENRSTALLMIVLMEEIGELAKASLEGGDVDRFRAEIIDASSVLRRMYIQAEETGCGSNSSSG
jgi:hypothetical protein